MTIIKLAQAVAQLDAEDYKRFREWTKFIKGLPSDAKFKAKPAKRKYKKRAPKAVEVAPGVKVVKRPRSKADEIDHSPRSVVEQG